MSNITTGMNIPEVQSLAGRLEQEAGQIEQIISIITSQLNSTGWVGPDATRFRGDWTGTHTSHLRTVANELKNAASAARTNAAQQQDASNR